MNDVMIVDFQLSFKELVVKPMCSGNEAHELPHLPAFIVNFT